MTEDTPETFDSPEAEIRSIQDTILTDPGAYHGDQTMQARLVELVNERDQGVTEEVTKEPSVLDADQERELEKIREVIRTDPGQYWSDKAMQARFQQLLIDPPAEASGGIVMQDLEHARLEIMQSADFEGLIKEWGPQAEKRIESYHGWVSDLMTNDIEPEHAEEIHQEFLEFEGEAAPALAKWSITMRNIPDRPEPDLDANLAEFNNTNLGIALRQIWRDSYKDNVTRFRSRVFDLRDSMSDEAWAGLLERFDALSDSAAMAVIKKVVRT